MRLSDLEFDLPEELIAQRPVEPRDSCRLLVVDVGNGSLSDHVFRDLGDLLRPGDVLVLNDSRVIPARIRARKSTGGQVELLFLRQAALGLEGNETWEALARPSNRLRAGMALTLTSGDEVHLEASLADGCWLVGGPSGRPLLDILEAHGEMPVPPYIKTPLKERGDYQTIYATTPGSAAAPTAGLHFTPELLERLEALGVERANVTLHVGLDTFRPITTDTVEDHRIHTEAYSVEPRSLALITAARRQGRRLVAVGTTSVRVLETLFAPGQKENEPAPTGLASLFITPGYRFTATDALITNFHLPRTSLLALVMAFAGPDVIRRAYRHAISQRYRFFSFGDAMLLGTGWRRPCGGEGSPDPEDWRRGLR